VALPHNVVRDYAGGVVQGVQLTAQIGSTDLSFTIANTTGWVNAAGNPLGTAGPFSVVIDQGAASVEKICCTSVNLTSGLVTVYNVGGTNGRGYDQTTPQAHVPGASPTGVQPCWTAVEAAEANAAVVFGPGGGGAVVGLTGNPAGRIYLTADAGGVSGVVLLNGATFLVGGMTDDLVTNHSLIVPTTGYYLVNGGWVEVASGAGTGYSTILLNGTGVAIGSQGYLAGAGNIISQVSTIVHATASQYFQLGFSTSVGSNHFQGSTGASCYLDVALISK
jgi:hypothetical protein